MLECRAAGTFEQADWSRQTGADRLEQAGWSRQIARKARISTLSLRPHVLHKLYAHLVTHLSRDDGSIYVAQPQNPISCSAMAPRKIDASKTPARRQQDASKTPAG
jgi:hypothetical protein